MGTDDLVQRMYEEAESDDERAFRLACAENTDCVCEHGWDDHESSGDEFVCSVCGCRLDLMGDVV
jgi:hypothetical protein